MYYFSDSGESYVEGEENEKINWDDIARLDDRYLDVLSIEDPEKRLDAARALTREMAGE